MELLNLGDIILFPNDKGLVAGKCSYRDANGEVKQATAAIFLTENKIFTKLSEIKQ